MSAQKLFIIGLMFAGAGLILYAQTRQDMAAPVPDVPVSPGAGIGQFSGETIWGPPAVVVRGNGAGALFGVKP